MRRLAGLVIFVGAVGSVLAPFAIIVGQAVLWFQDDAWPEITLQGILHHQGLERQRLGWEGAESIVQGFLDLPLSVSIMMIGCSLAFVGIKMRGKMN